ncbi:MAG: ribonuclease HII [Clostridia bacterium]|nr:ribonuclease HII [Clostridia bacterium]
MSRKTNVDPVDMWKFEKELYDQYKVICGIDEAGRGCLCGNVCAAAVILPPNIELPGVTDSKKLSPKKREELFDVIASKAVSYGIGWATPEEIDEINILNAAFLAMKRAADALEVKPEMALIDGNKIRGFEIPTKCIVKGDSLSISIAAASILAKVSRDRYMCQLSEQYPQYKLDVHKGYPTKEHYKLLAEHGVQPIYRKSFLKNVH